MASVGLAGALALCTGNAAYLFNSMAFVEILKGFAPVVTMCAAETVRLWAHRGRISASFRRRVPRSIAGWSKPCSATASRAGVQQSR